MTVKRADPADVAYRKIRANHLLVYPECRACGSEERPVPHHLRYRGKGKEQPGDLVTLCWPCHHDFHLSLGRRGTSVEATIRYCQEMRAVVAAS